MSTLHQGMALLSDSEKEAMHDHLSSEVLKLAQVTVGKGLVTGDWGVVHWFQDIICWFKCIFHDCTCYHHDTWVGNDESDHDYVK
jgi:hypothetical protein